MHGLFGVSARFTFALIAILSFRMRNCSIGYIDSKALLLLTLEILIPKMNYRKKKIYKRQPIVLSNILQNFF